MGDNAYIYALEQDAAQLREQADDLEKMRDGMLEGNPTDPVDYYEYNLLSAQVSAMETLEAIITARAKHARIIAGMPYEGDLPEEESSDEK